jgi:hypothetical protein
VAVAAKELPIAVVVMRNAEYGPLTLEYVLATEGDRVLWLRERPPAVKGVRVSRHDG